MKRRVLLSTNQRLCYKRTWRTLLNLAFRLRTEDRSRFIGAVLRRKYLQLLIPALRNLNVMTKSASKSRFSVSGRQLYMRDPAIKMRSRLIKRAADMCLAGPAAIEKRRHPFRRRIRHNSTARRFPSRAAGTAALRRRIDNLRRDTTVSGSEIPILSPSTSNAHETRSAYNITEYEDCFNSRVMPIASTSNLHVLQKIIPGCSRLLDPAKLLEETGLYIVALQVQVDALRALTSIGDSVNPNPNDSMPA